MYQVLLTYNLDAFALAEVPALPGCITEGDTMDEVMANLKDAIEGWLDVANSRVASIFTPLYPS
ncbi:type II toxin-antitoxin system HicB family antitoxin [Microcoleus sp. N3A4]|uniref:type II toxin-antitoxin system HicB family antitoxin n=1 Tax=Microcoleus sp. N3A4 TaxID=3055379 RepID=UPI002FD2B87E